MRIDLLKLNPPRGFDLARQIVAISLLPLDRRNRMKAEDNIRLEYHEQHGHLWYCDFIRLRMNHGPSRAGVGTAVQGFDLGEDEGFGEETAFLWDSRTNWCVVQYNHYGVRPQTIADYLGDWDHENPVALELQPKIDNTIQAKVQTKTHISKVTVVVAPKLMGDEDFDIGGGLGTATKALKRESDADRIEITISAKRTRSIDLNGPILRRWALRLADKISGREAAVSTARITARAEDDRSAEVLDLLRATVTDEADLTAGADRRYPREARWGALAAAHLRWADLMR